MRKYLIILGLFFACHVSAQVVKTSVSFPPVAEGSTLLNGLVSYFKLDEPSGTTVDDAVETLDLTNTGATVNQAEAKIGKSYKFVTDDYLGNVNTTYEFTEVSVSAWAYTTGSAAYQVIASHKIYGSSTGFALTFSDWGYRPEWTVGDGASTPDNATVISGDALSDSTWYHLVGTFDGTTARLYVNGASVGTPVTWAHDILYDATGRFCIGIRSTDNYPMNGYIDEIAIWNRGLTSSEVTELYNGGTGITYPF